MNVFNIVLAVYISGLFLWFGYVYEHNPQLLYWTRVFIIGAYPSMALLFNIDVLREMFIGLQIFVITFLAEFSIVVFSLIIAYILCFK